MTILGQRIRHRREFLGYSIEGLAESASVPGFWLELLESGELKSPDIRCIWRIANSLQVKPLELMEQLEVVSSPPVAQQPEQRDDSPSYAALVASADWPIRLVDATRIKFFLAQAEGDREEMLFWRGALEIALGLARKERAA